MRELISYIVCHEAFTEGVAWKRRRLKAGESVIKKGEIGKTLFFVEEGCVRILGDAEIGDNRKISPGLCDLNSGAIFGDICLFGSHQRTASVVALSDVVLLEIDSEMLSIFLDEHPQQGYYFLKSLFQVMADRLKLANDRIENLLIWGLKAHDIDKYL